MEVALRAAHGRRAGHVAIVLSSLLMGTNATEAQTYPVRPIRFIVPNPPGGPTDLIGRSINELLAKRLGQPVIIDNRGGAATLIGAELAARAPADGYTFLIATVTTLAVNPALSDRLPYDPVRDFVPVSMLAGQPYLLAVHPSIAATSVEQLIGVARSQPGRITFGSGGVGSGAHLAGEMFKRMANVDLSHVPYKGTGPAMTDLMSGQLNAVFGSISAVYPHASTGRLRVLAVTSARRSPGLPEIPTIAEAGIAGYGTSSWNALMAPRGTPPAAIELLNRSVREVLTQPEVRERLRRQGIDADPGTPAQLASTMKAEMARFRTLIQALGLRGIE